MPTAVVTGASSGIGRACVETLMTAGWQVVAVARRAERLTAVSEATGCYLAVCDVTSDADVSAMVDTVSDVFDGTLDAIVNIAGGAFGVDRVEAADLDHWKRMYEVNVLGTTRVTQARRHRPSRAV